MGHLRCPEREGSTVPPQKNATSIFDWISGEVSNGVVTLKGSVREPWRKTDYERRAEAVAGVRQVDNEIEILPRISVLKLQS